MQNSFLFELSAAFMVRVCGKTLEIFLFETIISVFLIGLSNAKGNHLQKKTNFEITVLVLRKKWLVVFDAQTPLKCYC